MKDNFSDFVEKRMHIRNSVAAIFDEVEFVPDPEIYVGFDTMFGTVKGYIIPDDFLFNPGKFQYIVTNNSEEYPVNSTDLKIINKENMISKQPIYDKIGLFPVCFSLIDYVGFLGGEMMQNKGFIKSVNANILNIETLSFKNDKNIDIKKEFVNINLNITIIPSNEFSEWLNPIVSKMNILYGEINKNQGIESKDYFDYLLTQYISGFGINSFDKNKTFDSVKIYDFFNGDLRG
ncbi:hypothetical protein K9L67_00815 [Candidatus Woesearchaeota archaeon]|nr:hypothetical protein [Candidatus Woesearchaeota archaeon]MCF7900747.1 hypothetical protein [Candidatus Woesearchaeota archaeon]MCF8012912.1 hypothetical protein [Candidatus Woesearchaeota archaeon]